MTVNVTRGKAVGYHLFKRLPRRLRLTRQLQHSLDQHLKSMPFTNPRNIKEINFADSAAAGSREIHAQPVRGKRAAKVIFSLRSGSGVNEAVMLVFNPVRPKRAASRPFRCEFRPQVAIRCRLNGGASAATAAELIDLDGYK